MQRVVCYRAGGDCGILFGRGDEVVKPCNCFNYFPGLPVLPVASCQELYFEM